MDASPDPRLGQWRLLLKDELDGSKDELDGACSALRFITDLHVGPDLLTTRNLVCGCHDNLWG